MASPQDDERAPPPGARQSVLLARKRGAAGDAGDQQQRVHQRVHVVGDQQPRAAGAAQPLRLLAPARRGRRRATAMRASAAHQRVQGPPPAGLTLRRDGPRLAASASRAARRPSSTSTNAEQAAAHHEEHDRGPGWRGGWTRWRGSSPRRARGRGCRANFSNTPKKPKNSADLWRGIMVANSERLSAWVPPCTMPTRTASTKKSVGGRHVVAEQRDRRGRRRGR